MQTALTGAGQRRAVQGGYVGTRPTRVKFFGDDQELFQVYHQTIISISQLVLIHNLNCTLAENCSLQNFTSSSSRLQIPIPVPVCSTPGTESENRNSAEKSELVKFRAESAIFGVPDRNYDAGIPDLLP